MSDFQKNCQIVKGLWLEFSDTSFTSSLEDYLEKIDIETVLGAHFAMGYLNNHCQLNPIGKDLVDKSRAMLIEFLENEEDGWEFDESLYLND